jgi:transposase-like protein
MVRPVPGDDADLGRISRLDARRLAMASRSVGVWESPAAALIKTTAGLTVRQSIVEVARSHVTSTQISCPICGEEYVGRLVYFFRRKKLRCSWDFAQD